MHITTTIIIIKLFNVWSTVRQMARNYRITKK